MELHTRSLDQLEQRCRRCLHGCLPLAPSGKPPWPAQATPSGCAACRELAERALWGGNDAAWDLLVLTLWPLVLRWVYATLPEALPAAAEQLSYRALWTFRTAYAEPPHPPRRFPPFATLLADLQQTTVQVCRGSG